MKRLLIIVTVLLANASLAAPLIGQDASSAGDNNQQGQGSKAVTAGKLTAKPTLVCIGLYCPIQGDVNRNAVAEVQFRANGGSKWKAAMPLWRMWPQKVDIANNTVGGITSIFSGKLSKWDKGWQNNLIKGYAQNYFAGSIFHLEPGTTYEVKVEIKDPDGGGGVRTFNVTTRKTPVLPARGNVIHVRGGGDALKASLAKASAGDIFLVHAGTYNSAIVVGASGTADKPIVIRAAGDGEVVIRSLVKKKNDRRWTWDDDKEEPTDGLTLYGSYIHLHGLTIRHCFIGVYCGKRPTESPEKPTGIAITRCRFDEVFNVIYGKGDDCYFADNRIRGDWHGGNEGEGIEVHGNGNVICYNTISHVADGISLTRGSRNCDVYNNRIFYCGDDGLEFDGGGPNLRLFDNCFSVSEANGISVQPYYGGPAYVIRNQISNIYENTIKDRYKALGVVLINNTFIPNNFTALPEHVYARNNLFLSRNTSDPAKTGKSTVVSYHIADMQRDPRTLDLDYNGYTGLIGGYHHRFYLRLPNKPQALSVKAFVTTTGMESHGVSLSYNSLFHQPKVMTAEEKRRRNNWVGDPCPDLNLKSDAPAIDKGVVIPNIIEKFNGKAPDLGAIEFGTNPHWGIRPVTTVGK